MMPALPVAPKTTTSYWRECFVKGIISNGKARLGVQSILDTHDTIAHLYSTRMEEVNAQKGVGRSERQS